MKIFLIFLSVLFLAGCSDSSVDSIPSAGLEETQMYTTEPEILYTQAPAQPDPLEELLESMSLEERVGQLFLARCDSATAVQHVQMYHLGGFVLFASDFQEKTPESVSDTLASYQAAARIPLLLAVDEEGGTVTRISRYKAFRSEPFPSPRSLFETIGYEAVLDAEAEKSRLLSSLGLNVNLGPVCDITDDPNAFMYQRSLGQSPAVTGRYIMDTVAIMEEARIGSALKHFPGYGNNPDTHTGIAQDSRTLEELTARDLVPFRSGIQAGCDAILVSHTIVEALDPENPASLSPAVHQYLRENLEFSGVIITDDLVMQAITERYGAGEAAVLAVLAGNDLLCSTEYQVQYEAVLAAVMDGRIHLRVLNQAVRNVLEWKQELGLLN